MSKSSRNRSVALQRGAAEHLVVARQQARLSASRRRKGALLASCAFLAAALIPDGASRAANDGVIFSGADVNNGQADGTNSFAISAGGAPAAGTPAGGLNNFAIGHGARVTGPETGGSLAIGPHSLAFAGAYRIRSNVQLNGGVAMSPNQSVAGGRAGVRVGF